MSETKVVLEKISASPLRVGTNQKLVLSVSVVGEGQVFVVVPLSADNGLMSESEFRKLADAQKVSLTKGKDVDFAVSNITSGEATLDLSFAGDGPWSCEIGFEGIAFDSQRRFKIEVRDFNSASLTSLELEVGPAESVKILTFEPDRYNLPSAAKVKLKFTLSARPQGDTKITINGKSVEVVTDAKTGTPSGSDDFSVDKESDFTLNVLVGSASVDTRQLRINTFKRPCFTDFAPQLSFDHVQAEGLVGIHAHGGRLYVLRHAPQAAEPSAAMWSSLNGFDPADDQWEQVKDGAGKPVLIPLRIARRPAVVFKDRLWLMGGDCCNPNRRGADISYFDFTERYWFAGGGDLSGGRWPADVGERMGHTLLAGPDGRLWVIGGWNQGGPCQEIWCFTGDGKAANQWTRLMTRPPWTGRCLVGATTVGSKVFVAGGFDEPGGEGYNDILVYDHQSGSWRTLTRPLIIPSGDADPRKYQFCACTVSALATEPQVLATYYRFETSEHDHSLSRIVADGDEYTKVGYNEMDKLSSAGLFRTEDYYRLFSNVFNGSLFIWSIGANLTDPNSMRSSGSYFTRRDA